MPPRSKSPRSGRSKSPRAGSPKSGGRNAKGSGSQKTSKGSSPRSPKSSFSHSRSPKSQKAGDNSSVALPENASYYERIRAKIKEKVLTPLESMGTEERATAVLLGGCSGTFPAPASGMITLMVISPLTLYLTIPTVSSNPNSKNNMSLNTRRAVVVSVALAINRMLAPLRYLLMPLYMAAGTWIGTNLLTGICVFAVLKQLPFGDFWASYVDSLCSGVAGGLVSGTIEGLVTSLPLPGGTMDKLNLAFSALSIFRNGILAWLLLLPFWIIAWVVWVKGCARKAS